MHLSNLHQIKSKNKTIYFYEMLKFTYKSVKTHGWHLCRHFRTVLAIFSAVVVSVMNHGHVFSVTLHFSVVVGACWCLSQLGRVVVAGNVEVRHRVSCRGKRTAGRNRILPAAEERPGTPLSDYWVHLVFMRVHMCSCYASCMNICIHLYMARHSFNLICM